MRPEGLWIATPAYEAVSVVKPPHAPRRKLVVAAGVFVLAVVAAVLLSVDRQQAAAGPPSSFVVSEAAAALSMGRAQVHMLEEDPSFSQDMKNGAGKTVGAYTGHTKGALGDPITFGPGTYNNVFDPDPLRNSPGNPFAFPGGGMCQPGHFGEPGKCEECPVGKWCPGNKDSKIVNDCPEHSTSSKGSYKPDQCSCQPGWFGIAVYNAAQSCKKCLAGTYCPGRKEQYKCPAHSSSADEAAACSCDAGYKSSGTPFGDTDCKTCETDHYCPGGEIQTDCPVNAISPSGSDSGADCKCTSGFYEPKSAADPSKGPDCFVCAANFYCPGGKAAFACPANMASTSGQSSIAGCTCVPGFYADTVAGCKVCPAGNYCSGGVKKSCAAGSKCTFEGCKSQEDCVCSEGFYGTKGDCKTCPVDHFCPGGDKSFDCPPNSKAPEGAGSCACMAGFTSYGGNCWPDAAQLKPGSKTTDWNDAGCVPPPTTQAAVLTDPLADIVCRHPAYLMTSATSWDGKFLDVSGNGRVGTLRLGAVSSGTVNGNGAGRPIAYVGGNVNTGISFGQASIPSTFTICSITRYTGPTKKRILYCYNKNWLHGHWEGNAGSTYYDSDKAGKLQYSIQTTTDWVVACGRNIQTTGSAGVIINGVVTAFGSAEMKGGGNCELAINMGGSYLGNENSDWQLSKLYVWNTHLPDAVFADVEARLNKFLTAAGSPPLPRPWNTINYLDQQNVDCKGLPMSSFQMNSQDNQKIRYSYSCSTGAKWNTPIEKASNWNDAGRFQLEFLDRQNVECPPGMGISDFQLQTGTSPKLMQVSDGGNVRYTYKCVAPSFVGSKISCKDYSTPDNDAGGFGAKVEYLDRHAVSCSANEVLNRFQLKMGAPGKIKYDYRCCTVDGRNDESAIAQFGSPTGGWQLRVWNYPCGTNGGAMPAFDFVTNSFRMPEPPIIEKSRVTDMTFDDNKWKAIGAPDDNFAAVVSGFLNVQNAGQYEFWTKSDDGSELWIDKARVVDNSGLHAPETKTGTVSLSKGLHSILVPFVECGGGAYLQISWKGPDTGGKEQPVDLQGI